MNQESIYINQNPNQDTDPDKRDDLKKNKVVKKQKIENNSQEFKNPVMSSETKLWVVTLILVFVAFNIWGYYFYKKGFFGISADITTTTPTPSSIQNPDSIYMIPGI